MTATAATALVPLQPAFSDAERLALAGFLAGYRGLTREAYALDLRQFTTWCRGRLADDDHAQLPECEREPQLDGHGGPGLIKRVQAYEFVLARDETTQTGLPVRLGLPLPLDARRCHEEQPVP